ncbi:MAG: T9SS type A sorting domain-containing protein [Crocinitomicaceae bacterium]
MRLLIGYILLSFSSYAQSFAPEPGVPGSTAIHSDSSIILEWVSNLTVSRGYLDIAIPGLGFTTYGTAQDAIGAADGISVVSLGDGGEAVVQLERPIFDGPGPDFAIFENGFVDHYMEFAFVEVSTNGVDFVRFVSTSEIPVTNQIDNFSSSDCRMVNNLAGKYRQSYGTPFDLSELSDSSAVDISEVNYIRLIDVVGSIDPIYGSFDAYGNLINDPYPTPFESGGFDLDAIGLINVQELGISQKTESANIFPNPFSSSFNIELSGEHTLQLIDLSGRLHKEIRFTDKVTMNAEGFLSGIYLCFLDDQQPIKIVKL